MTPDLPGLSQQIAHFEGRLIADPGSRVYLPLADLYKRVGRLQEAYEILERGLSTDPGCVSARLLLGVVLNELSRKDDAREALLAVHAQDADNLMALRLLGDDAELRGDWLQACNYRERLLRLLPDDSDIRQALREALNLARSSGELAKIDSDGLAPQAQVDRAVSQGHTQPAVSVRNMPCGDGPAPAFGVETPTLADLYRQQGYPEKARQIIARILAADPERTEALAVLDRLEQDARDAAVNGEEQGDRPTTEGIVRMIHDPKKPHENSRRDDDLKRFRQWLESGQGRQ